MPISPARFARNVPFLAGAAVGLVLGVWAGLARLSTAIDPAFAHQPGAHGPLMVGGFLGALIGLERAVALGHRGAFLVPALAVAGTVAIVLRPDPLPAGALLVAAAVVAVVVSAALHRRRRDLAQATMGLGSVAWLVGNLLWAGGWPTRAAVPWWGAFLVLTVVGERLELSAVLSPPPRARRLFLAALAGLVAGLVALGLDESIGGRILGLGLLAATAWLLRWDLARRTIRRPGRLRFMASCLLGGYLWLGVAGAILAVLGELPAGWTYDAVVHAVFLGFVFSMIFGHAPIVAKAVLGVEVPYRTAFWGHLVLLHLSLLLRIAGDLAGSWELRTAGGTLGAAAIGLFLVASLASGILGEAPRPEPPARPRPESPEA